MSSRNRVRAIVFLLVGVATLAACGGGAPRLEPDERFAYEIKPAVVRVNAYATARFSYPADEIRGIGGIISKSVPGASVRRLSGAPTEEVEAGVGMSGSGFIVNHAGFILASAGVTTAIADRAQREAGLRRNGAIAALVRHFTADPLRQLAKEAKLEPLVERLARGGELSDLSIVEDVELANGERYGFERRRTADAADDLDVAVIRIRRRNLPAIRVGASAPVRVQDPVWVVGYPQVTAERDERIGGWLLRDADLEATLTAGVVTTVGTDSRGRSRFVTSAAFDRGVRGGPALSRGDGAVIGIAMLSAERDTTRTIVPIDPVRQIVEEAGVAFDDGGDFQGAWRLALDKIERGRLSEARSELAFANELFPNYPDVIRFQAEAERSSQGSSLSGTTIAVVGLLVAAVVVLGLVAAYFASRARRSGAMIPPPIPPVTRETYVSPSSRDGSERVPEPGDGLLGKLTILNGDRAGERIGLGGSGIRVGREHSMCEIVLENPKVSRLHAEFVEVQGRVLLIDRNSSNGTYVNDQKIDKRFLKDGDIIYFGGRNAIAVAFNA
jgi:S1-C subfamily serine protease